jgi:hypothetical protein
MEGQLNMKLMGIVSRLVCFCALVLLLPAVQAASFTVSDAQMDIDDDPYRLSAQLVYELSDEVNEALQNGIPVTLRMDVEIFRKREYLWAQTIIVVRQRFRLQYHALSEQYLVNNLNTGEQTFYKVLGDALYNLEHIVNFPVINAAMLDPKEEYYARVRTSVDIKELPVPLRFFAYFSSGWNLNSGWFSWSLSGKGEV